MFRSVKAPTKNELTRLTHTIAQRVGRYLERQGLVERDTGNIYLTPEAVDASDEDPSNQLLGSLPYCTRSTARAQGIRLKAPRFLQSHLLRLLCGITAFYGNEPITISPTVRLETRLSSRDGCLL